MQSYSKNCGPGEKVYCFLRVNVVYDEIGSFILNAGTCGCKQSSQRHARESYDCRRSRDITTMKHQRKAYRRVTRKWRCLNQI